MEAKIDRRALIGGLVALASGCGYNISFVPKKPEGPSLEELARAERSASDHVQVIGKPEDYYEFIKKDAAVVLVYDKHGIDIEALRMFKELAEEYPSISFAMIRTDSEAALPAVKGTRYIDPSVQVYRNGKRVLEGTLVMDSTHPSEVSAKAVQSYLAEMRPQ